MQIYIRRRVLEKILHSARIAAAKLATLYKLSTSKAQSHKCQLSATSKANFKWSVAKKGEHKLYKHFLRNFVSIEWSLNGFVSPTKIILIMFSSLQKSEWAICQHQPSLSRTKDSFQIDCNQK